jgi:hypothetical protein
MSTSLSDTPVPTPGSISYNSVLAEDFITSDGVLVAAQAPGQVGVFRNPGTDAVEALVIARSGNISQQLMYLAQDPTSLTGWSLAPVKTAIDYFVTASQVVAVANTSGGVDGFFVDLLGTLQQISLRGGAWSAPTAVPGAPTHLGALRVAYSPGATASAGTVVLYAGDDANSVFLYVHQGGRWTAQSLALGGAASSWALSLTSETAWYLTIVAKYNFTFRPNDGQPVGVVKESEMGWATGTLGAAGLAVSAAGIDRHTYAAVVFNGTAMAGTSDVMALGLAGAGDDSGGHEVAWLLDPHGDSRYGTIRGTSFQSVSFVQSTDGYVSIYGIDPQRNLFTLRQVAYDPHDMDTGYGTTQTWGPIFALDARIEQMYPNPAITDAPALIAVDADQGALHLYEMDPTTHLWLAKPIRLPADRKYEITRWQTDISVYDTDGNPLAGYPITVKAASAVDMDINGAYRIVDTRQRVEIRTNALGKATVLSLATSLSPPALTISGDAVPPQASHSPGAPVNDYLAGTGAILGKDAFSAGDVARLSGVSSAEAERACQAIQTCAAMGQAAAGDAGARARLDALVARGEAVHVYRRTPGGLVCHRFARLEEARAMLDAELGARARWDDVWDTASDFIGDVWHAIENGVHEVAHFIVDVARGAVTLMVEIGGELVQLAEWVIETVEAGLLAVSAVFNWIRVKAEQAIDWLKALFDFQAIWNTKTVFQGQLDALTRYLLEQIDTWSNLFEGGFFEKRKAAIDGFFDRLIAEWDGKTFTELNGWPGMGAPVSDKPLVGSATQSDLTTNPLSNWMQNKVSSYMPPDTGRGPAESGDAIENFFDALVNVGEDTLQIFVDLYRGIAALFDPENPASFQDIAVSTFLRVIKDAADALLDTCDLIVQALFALAELAIKGFQAILETRLDVGYLNEVYRWVMGKVGVQDDELTVSDLMCLLAAFPATILYKLIAGADKEPFPDGLPPSAELRRALRAGEADAGVAKEVYQVFGTVAGALTTLGAVWTTAGDAMDTPPSWIGWASKITTGVRLAFTHPGFLAWTPLQWGSVAAAAANLLWLAPTAYFINKDYNVSGKVIGGVEGKLESSGLAGKGWVFDDLTKLGFSVFGLINLGVVVFNVVMRTDPPFKTTANVIEATVTPFSFITMRPIKNLNIEGIPIGRIAQALKIILDVTAGVDGGMLEITSAWTEQQATAGAM